MSDIDAIQTQFGYDDFIRSIFPEDNQALVSIDTSILIEIGPNIDKHILYVPSLFDRKALVPSTAGDMLGFYQGILHY